MRLVDSSAWIEFLSGPPFEHVIAREFPSQEDWLVPTIVQFELAKWYRREGRPKKLDEVMAFTTFCRVVELDTATSLLAAGLSVKHRLAAADAIIYATAVAYGADLLTCDRHFEGLPGIVFVAKPAA